MRERGLQSEPCKVAKAALAARTVLDGNGPLSAGAPRDAEFTLR